MDHDEINVPLNIKFYCLHRNNSITNTHYTIICYSVHVLYYNIYIYIYIMTHMVIQPCLLILWMIKEMIFIKSAELHKYDNS